MKSPPTQFTDDEARILTEQFIAGEDRSTPFPTSVDSAGRA
jgi:hypothetical protein